MEQIVLSGFSDEIAPELDIQLAAIREWGLPHRAVGGRRGKCLGLFPRESERSESQAGGGGVSLPPSARPWAKSPLRRTRPPTWRRSSAPGNPEGAGRAPTSACSASTARGPGPRPLPGGGAGAPSRMVEEAAAWDSVLLPRERRRASTGTTPPAARICWSSWPGPHFQAVFDFANFYPGGPGDAARLWAAEALCGLCTRRPALHRRRGPRGPGGRPRAGHPRRFAGRRLEGAFLSLEPHLTDFGAWPPWSRTPEAGAPP